MSGETGDHIIDNPTKKQKLFVWFEVLTILSLIAFPILSILGYHAITIAIVTLYLAALVHGIFRSDSNYVGVSDGRQ